MGGKRLPEYEVGQQVGWLTIVDQGALRGPDGKRRYLCRCRCGAKLAVLRDSLIRGSTTSCGCRKQVLHQSLMGRTFRQYRSKVSRGVQK